MESNIKVEHLFHRSRLPEGLALFFLPFYIPLGIVVTVIRFFFALQLYIILSILPKTWLIRRLLLRISGSLVGMFVTQQGLELCHGQHRKMIISNHITHLDNLAFESIMPCVMKPDKTGQLPGLMRYILKYDNVEPEELPLLVFPEGSSTSGTKGLLKFKTEPFDQENEPFLIALLSISRPYFVQIAPSVLGSYWWSDLLWILFSPYTHFRIRFMKPPEREEGQSNEEYSVSNQHFMASNLGLTATKFDAKEKAEYTKRLIHEQAGVVRAARTNAPTEEKAKTFPGPSNCVPTISKQGSKNDFMAGKVKDVLPQVPIDVIKADLKKTKCIDTTISNILEGKVSYNSPQQASSQEKQQNSKTALGVTKVAAKSFGKSSTERHLSFQERKAAFIEAARQKYIEKHNLQTT